MKFWDTPGRWKTDGIGLIGGDQTHCEETTSKKWIDPEKPRTEGKYSSRRESHPQSQAPNATLWRHGAPGLKNALELGKKQRRAWSNFWESEEENRNAALLGRQRPWISHWMKNTQRMGTGWGGRQVSHSLPRTPLLPPAYHTLHILMGNPPALESSSLRSQQAFPLHGEARGVSDQQNLQNHLLAAHTVPSPLLINLSWQDAH